MAIEGLLSGPVRHLFLLGSIVAGPLGALVLLGASRAGMLPVAAPPSSARALAIALIVAPVLEECVFRGGVQELLERRQGGARPVLSGVDRANVLTSLLFAVFHLPSNPWWLAAGAFFPSLVFGIMKQLYRSLLPAMALHAWYNACFVLAFRL